MRKLAVTATAFSCAVFLAVYLLPFNALLPSAVIFAVLMLLMSLKFRRGKVFCLAVIGFSLGMLCFYLHYDRTVLHARELNGISGEYSVSVLSFPYDGGSYLSTELELDGLRTRIYDYDGDTAALLPGQTVSMKLKLRSAENRYGERDPYYNSRDIYLTGTYKGDLKLLSESKVNLKTLPAFIGRAVSNKIDELYTDENAAFMKALLIGDRSDFYADIPLTTAFGHAGFMHVVAVSGMHIGFLIGFIMLIFGRSWRSSLISIALIWLFAFSSGASPSVIRASFMQSLLLLAPVFRREDDAITTLSFALMAILAANPYSAASLSLQLSFAAVAGIILFAERIQSALMELFHLENPYSLAASAVGIAASSIAVMVFSAPLTAIYFGYFQLYGIVTNILGLWAVSLCFCLGQLSVLLGFILAPLGTFAAYPAKLAAMYILQLVRLISKLPMSAVYLHKPIMLIWLAFCYALFIFFRSRQNLKIKIAVPAAASVLALLLICTGVKLWYSAGAYFSVINVGQGQCISAYCGDSTVMVDCGGKASEDNPGKIAGAYLRSCGRNSIDTLIITHAHEDHANGIEQLMELVKARRIIVPKSEQSELYDKIVSLAATHNAELVVLSEDMLCETGGINADIIAPLPDAKDNEDSLILTLSVGDYDMLITGDSPSKCERRVLRDYTLNDIEVFIVGHHGSKYSNCDALLSSIGAERAIISVGYNSYGHPTEEVLARLAEYGYNVERTDEDGNIQIRIPANGKEI